MTISSEEFKAAADRYRGRSKRQTTGGDWGEGGPEASGWIDQYRAVKAPSAAELVRELAGVAFACANLNALTAASVPYRLYVQTRGGEARPRCATRPLSRKAMAWLAGRKHVAKQMASAVVVEEVEGHPVLDMLDGHRLMSGHLLRTLTMLYLDTVGRAFWLVEMAKGGNLPLALWPLPAQQVAVQRGKTLQEIIAGFKWGQLPVPPEQMVFLRFPSLADPYADGCSPLRAAWQSVLLQDKQQAHLHASLDNRARPDTIVAPDLPPDVLSGMGEVEATRLEERINRKFRKGGSGGIMVSATPLKSTAFSIAPKDLELVAQAGLSREEVANAYGVPTALLSRDTNLDNLRAARQQHARQAVEPRCILFDEAVNTQLIPLFDDTGRLFLAHDDCVPEDENLKVTVRGAALDRGVITINEARAEDGLEPVEGGDEPLVPSGKAPLSQIVKRDLSAPPTIIAPPPAPVGGGSAPRETPPGGPAPDEGASAPTEAEKAPPRPRGAASLPCSCGHAHGERATPASPSPSGRGQGEGAAADPKINIHGLPDGRALLAPLRRVIRRQGEAVLKAIREHPEAAMKAVQSFNGSTVQPFNHSTKTLADLPGIDWSLWDEEFAKACAPVLNIYAENGAKETIARLGATDEDAAWRVQLPQVREAVDKAAMRFAESTNQTTSMQLDQAIAKLKADLAEEMLSGENTLRELTKRVQAVFTDLSGDRAALIAQTEASRATHEAQLIAARQSGMVRGKQWLAHPGACDACQALADMGEVPLDDSFADDGKGGPYSVVDVDPLHPGCMCTFTEVLYPLDELLANPEQFGEGWGEKSYHAAKAFLAAQMKGAA